MKNLILCLAFAASSAAFADTSRFHSFFTSLTGEWEGSGVVHSYDSSGVAHDTKYDSNFRIESTADNTWTGTNSVTDETGRTSQGQVTYTARGDLLFVSSNGTLEPVQVMEATPLSLAYKLHRTDYVTGRSYDFIFRTELVGNELRGHNSIETNGVNISDDTFTAKRW